MGEHQHLNGAYYGPAIPPPKSHRPRRGGDCCCLGWCGCCVLKCLFQILFTIAVVIGIIALVIWLIFRPNAIKFHVNDASLTQFNLTSTNSLHYNLALNISIRNPNKKIGVYYDAIEARAFYEGQRLQSDFLPTFYQGHKNTTILNAAFDGQHLVVLGGDQVREFNEDKVKGEYDIDVKLYLRIRFKFGAVKTPRLKPKIKCELKVPLTTNGVSTSRFERTRCDVDF